MQDSIIYGPVNSRRLGRSLGINLSPYRAKLCSFNCLYCHYGWTRRLTADFSKYKNDLPHPSEVLTAVEEAMKSDLDFAYVTFSGNGEPSLHPDFADLAVGVAKLRDKYRPEVKTALLTNSTGLIQYKIRKALKYIDRPFCKLDAGTEETFQKINRPADGVKFNDMVEALVGLDHIFIQTAFMDGTHGNITEGELTAWRDIIKRIRPVEVHIYSIDRPVPDYDISLVEPERLEEIARETTVYTGIKTIAFYPQG